MPAQLITAVRKMKNNDGLTPDQTFAFLEVVDTSLHITSRQQFFSWLQGSFQYLIPHEVLLCGIRLGNEHEFQFESFISTRYVTDSHVKAVTQQEGVVSRAITSWRCTRRPTFLADGMSPGDFGTYVVPFAELPGVLQEIELRNIAAHGMGNQEGGISTFFCFSRITGQINANHAYLLELLVPHLHAVLTRVISNSDNTDEMNEVRSPITAREREILQWVHKGKTNWEISVILDISQLTVKNHVQNILRKLNVQSRSHAAVKGSKLGLV
jgi:transcriptional regulator EpsA